MRRQEEIKKLLFAARLCTRLHKFLSIGKQWKYFIVKRGVLPLVKGTSRRVIVVDSPDPKLFEQAIFIVKNEAFTKEGVTSQQVLGEA